MPTPPFIFVSHAHADHAVADAVVVLLQGGANVTSDRVLCTSLDGVGLDNGAKVASEVRGHLAGAAVVVVLLSEMYLSRPYCLCELGGAWANGRRLFPVTVGAVEETGVGHVLADTLARPLRDSSTLDELYEVVNAEVHAVAGTTRAPAALWNRRRDEFLIRVPELVAALEQPDVVARAELTRALADSEAMVSVVDDREAEVQRLRGLVEALKEAKDPADVVRIELDSLGDLERFESLAERAKKAVGELPPIVRDVLYHRFVGDDYEHDRDYPEDAKALKDAAQRQLIEFDGRTASLARSTGAVRRAEEATEALWAFIEGSGVPFWEWYEAEHERPPAIKDREFWEAHLGLR